MAKPLTWKQRRFVEEYPVDQNGAAAAVRAGYSASRARQSAWRLLRQPAIQEALGEVQDKLTKRSEANQDWIIEHLTENVKRAMQLEPVKDRGGKLTGEHTYQGNVANKALELLGRHLGMFTDKLKIEGDLLDDLTADDLASLARYLKEAGFGAFGEGEPETHH